ncbi:MAG TPA: AraC family transcriptional regulator [Dysgonomonas sp.]|nr:AraC family transcriptional regulator [Dysgonomonas sp.]
MKNIKIISLQDFYKNIAERKEKDINSLLPSDINKEIGHFNVFDLAETIENWKHKAVMPYNKRAFYKIGLIKGRSTAEYADKVIRVETNALLFGTPRLPYRWIPQDPQLTGIYCVFTDEFLIRSKSGIALDQLPIYQPGGYPVFQVTDDEANEIENILRKMQKELTSDYAYKYDLLRNYVVELIHYGQKLQPATALYPSHNAAARATALFIELLERQFPIESPQQKLKLRTAKDYADRLAVHVNHLNKVLKENTGKTTTELISSRLMQEAKILLKETDWNISEIAWSLGFEEIAHFSNFFKKYSSVTPLGFRSSD